MGELLRKSNHFDLAPLDHKTSSVLKNKLDLAEKQKRPLYEDFSDQEILSWYLYSRKSLKENQDRSERSTNEYRRELQMFISNLLEHGMEIGLDIDYIIEGSLFKSLEPRHLERYQEWLHTSSPYVKNKKEYSVATLERKTTIIKSFFQYLYSVGYLKQPIHNRMLTVSVRKDDRPDRDIGPTEIVNVLRYFREENHPIMFAIVLVLTTTGLRNEEFCNLTVSDIKKDKINGTFYLDVLGKGNKRRQIPLRDKVLNAIHMFRYARGLPTIEESEAATPLFTTNRLNRYSASYFSQYFKKEINNVPGDLVSGIELTPHFLRHAFAIISHLEGVDIYDIMRSLGHERIETTTIYLAKVLEKEKHAINQWSSDTLKGFI